jgi:hypothetical protein
VKTVIEKEGTSFRSKKNLMYILVAREDRTARMVEASRRFIAIKELKGARKSREDIGAYGQKIDELLKEADSTLNGTLERCYSLIYYPKGTEIKCITVADGYEGAKNFPDKVCKALIKGGKIVATINPEYIVDRIFGERTEMTVQELVTTFEEAPIHFLPRNKDVVYDAIKRGVQENQFAMYTGGIGDIIAIDQENFSTVGERFYFGRAPDSGVRDGYYLLPKERAKLMEGQLNEIAEQFRQSTGSHDRGSSFGRKKGEQTIITQPVTEKSLVGPEEIAEYQGWNLRQLDVSFTNARLFNQVKSTFSMMLLGQSGILFNLSVHSAQMDLKIHDSEIKDINAIIDLLSKLAGQFNEDLSVSLAIKFSKPAKVDQDLTDSIGEFSAIKTELSFNALVEK